MNLKNGLLRVRVKERILVFTLSIIGIAILYLLPSLPSYTKLAVVFLVLPSIFIAFRKGEKISERKYFIVLAASLFGTFVWDTIGLKVGLWGFSHTSVSFWIFGIPLEEYIWGLWFPTVVIGIYTSLPHFKNTKWNAGLKLDETVLSVVVFVLQLMVTAILFSNPVSYFAWVVLLALMPSVFFMFRKREHIDEYRLLLTVILLLLVMVAMDLVFIPANTWYYNSAALLGRVGFIPIDDFLFGIFNAILVIGFYTSIPVGNLLKKKW
jgi:lycopene cyclase domain-containing protein